ncbi:thioredoxin family protein [Erythrobacter sp.]|jgi:hypothetical protein|uniref:thioredoxin family protein n=1 Tax=Erythrobacter sp. TaxID=1042 RepID=UPI002EA4134E|nr:thioredoxin family protein [Erythrobacter sp.]
MIRAVLAGLLAALVIVGGAGLAQGDTGAHDYPEARSYQPSDDAASEVEAALARAAASGKRVLLVMGANWCHDSRALAGWLETERFARLIEREYRLIFVNIGMPQSGDGHDLALAARFGLDDLPGTPNLLVLTADGELVNGATATTWRNAASREGDAIYDELVRLSEAPVSEEVG